MSFDDEPTHVSPFDEPIDDYGFDEDDEFTKALDEGGDEPAAAPDNKTFIIAVAGLIGFLVIAMAMLAAYAVFVLPSKKHAQQTQVAQINAQNTAIAQGLTATAQAAAWTPTPTATPYHPPTATMKPSPTAVVAVEATPTGGIAIDATAFAVTATAIYLTNEAVSAATPLPTQLADGGFADGMGLPGLIALAVLLIVIIFLARRLRQAV